MTAKDFQEKKSIKQISEPKGLNIIMHKHKIISLLMEEALAAKERDIERLQMKVDYLQTIQ